MPSKKNPVFCAIDTKDLAHAKALCNEIAPYIGGIKLGLEFFVTHGVAGVKQVTEGLDLPLFLDLKFYDIPNTVAEAVRSCVRQLDIAILTLHASGGSAMIKAATKAASEEAKAQKKRVPLVVGVTVLTSMSEKDLSDTGIMRSLDLQATQLALLAKEAGCKGVVCSAYELRNIKETCGAAFKAVVPGIRPEGSAQDDQNRIMTPAQAIENGADYLVIGRPITQSDNPAEAAKSIAQSCGVSC